MYRIQRSRRYEIEKRANVEGIRIRIFPFDNFDLDMSASDRAAIKQAIQDYSLSNPGEALGMKQLRNELVERGLVFSDSRWNEALKPLVRDVIVEIVGPCTDSAPRDER